MKHFVIATCVACVSAFAANAETNDTVVLTLTSETDSDLSVTFTLDELAAIGAEEFTTSTIWTTGPQVFTGVLLHDFLEEQGVEGGTLLASAINDYTVEIPVEDAVEDGPIIAYQLNGEEMSVRDKGPLWIVYPYDAKSAYQTEVIYSRSIWQLDRIKIAE